MTRINGTMSLYIVISRLEVVKLEVVIFWVVLYYMILPSSKRSVKLVLKPFFLPSSFPS